MLCNRFIDILKLTPATITYDNLLLFYLFIFILKGIPLSQNILIILNKSIIANNNKVNIWLEATEYFWISNNNSWFFEWV